MDKRPMNKPWGITFFGTALIVLSLMAASNAILSAVYHSQGKSPTPLLKTLDIPYGILMAGFDQTAAIFLFFIYFFGGQAVVALAIGTAAFFLIRIRFWAKKVLLVFSSLNFIVMLLNIDPLVKSWTAGSALSTRAWTVLTALVFYGAFILYFLRPGIKKYFIH